MTLRLTAEQDRQLEDLARAQGISKQQAVSQAITEAYIRRHHGIQVDRAIEHVMAEHSGIIDALAET